MINSFLELSHLIGFFGIVCALTLGFAKLLSPSEKLASMLGLIAGVSMLGLVSGYAGGLSRTAAVGDIIPAALALAGGAAAYLFGIDRSKGIIASICALAFGLSLFLGFTSSAIKRGSVEAFQNHLAFCRDVLSDADILSHDEAFVRVVSLYGQSCAGVMAAELAIARNQPPGTKLPDDYRQLRSSMSGLLARAGVEVEQ